MATPFSDINISFLSQITDYKLAELEILTLEENLETWLMNALGYYSSNHKKLQNHDLILKQFNEDLDMTEKYILAKFMVLAYVDTYVITEQNLEQALTSKDYNTYSPANQLKALIDLKKQISSEANTLISRHSYRLEAFKDKFK